LEGILYLIGAATMDYTMNARVQGPEGNRQEAMAPCGCYKCQGKERWVAITISSDEEWRRFCDAIGCTPWAKDERFSDMIERLENQDELDKLVEDWTLRNDRDEIVDKLTTAEVCVAPVLNAKDILLDEELKKRGFFQMIDHPLAGSRPLQTQLPVKFSSVPKPPEKPAPLLGEHNKLILGEYLGMSDDELRELERRDVIGTAPPKEHLVADEKGLNVEVFERFDAIAKPEPDYAEQLAKLWPINLKG
jgi:crotonobetainyl-CoA:carnitine CoA-transferase CaiB-like acyl-CoA transferase